MISYMDLLAVIRDSRIRLSQGFRTKRTNEHAHSYDHRKDVWQRCLTGWLNYCTKLAEVKYGHIAGYDDDPGDCDDSLIVQRKVLRFNGSGQDRA